MWCGKVVVAAATGAACGCGTDFQSDASEIRPETKKARQSRAFSQMCPPLLKEKWRE
jgi:hypothetical protein